MRRGRKGECVQESKEKERVAMAQLQRAAERAGSWVWVKWSSSSMYCVVILSLSLNNIDSPMDVGDLSNHVKYCVSVLALRWAIISTLPVGFPNIKYASFFNLMKDKLGIGWDCLYIYIYIKITWMRSWGLDSVEIHGHSIVDITHHKKSLSKQFKPHYKSLDDDIRRSYMAR